MLADVDAGSDTPSLVGKVLKWRKENPEGGGSLLSLSFFLPFLLAGRRGDATLTGL